MSFILKEEALLDKYQYIIPLASVTWGVEVEKRVFIGLIRTYRTRIGRIKAKEVEHGRQGEDKGEDRQ